VRGKKNSAQEKTSLCVVCASLPSLSLQTLKHREKKKTKTNTQKKIKRKKIKKNKKKK